MNNFTGIYVGIVVQNNDPETRGRVKVYVPSVHAQPHEDWNADGKDKSFQKISDDILSVIGRLKEILPWANCASPLLTTGTDYRWNNTNNDEVANDGYVYNPDDPESGQKRSSALPQTLTDIAGENFIRDNHNNKTKLTISIPDVGAHVLVFFREGNHDHPIYFALLNNSAIANFGDNLPNGFSNNKKDETVYQNKLLIHRKGGAIEIIDTDKKEEFTLSHFNGSYLSFLNDGRKNFTNGTDRSLITGEHLFNVKGRTVHTFERLKTETTHANRITNIGKSNKTFQQQWFELYRAALTSDLFDSTLIDNLYSVEKNFTDGDDIHNVRFNRNSRVGEVINTATPITYDPSGIIETKNLFLTSAGTEIVYFNDVKEIISQNTDIPFGNQNDVIGNSWNATVGCGGIRWATDGKISFTGRKCMFAGNTVDINSELQTKIRSKTKLELSSPIIVIRATNGGQVLLDSNTGITKNLNIKGSLYVDGEAHLNHVSAPLSFQITEPTKLQAGPGKWMITGATLTADQGINTNVTIFGGTLKIDETHTHHFKNIPLTLSNNQTTFKGSAAEINDDEAKSAKSIANGYSNRTSQPSDGYNGPK